MAITPYNSDRDLTSTRYSADRSVDALAKQVVRQADTNMHEQLREGIRGINGIYNSISDPAEKYAFGQAARNSHLELAAKLKAVDSITNEAVQNTLRDYYRSR